MPRTKTTLVAKNGPIKTKKSPWKIILVIFLILVFTAGGGVGGFYFAKIRGDQKKDDLQRQVDDLTKQITTLNKQIKNLKKQISTLAGECPSTLTDEDLLAIADWKAYTNSKYGCSLKYPKSWKVKTNEDDRLLVTGENDFLTFEFLSGDSAIRGYEEYDIISEKDIKIACIDCKRSYIKGNTAGNKTHRVLGAAFTREDVLHFVVISFTTQGASFDGDIEDAFDLITKTITFKS